MSGAKSVEQETIEAASGFLQTYGVHAFVGLLGVLMSILGAGVKRIFNRTDDHEVRIKNIEVRNAGADQTLTNMEGYLDSLSKQQKEVGDDVKTLLINTSGSQPVLPPELVAFLAKQAKKDD